MTAMQAHLPPALVPARVVVRTSVWQLSDSVRVDVQGFSSRVQRDLLRSTWVPTGKALQRLEKKDGIVIRFIIGRSCPPPLPPTIPLYCQPPPCTTPVLACASEPPGAASRAIRREAA